MGAVNAPTHGLYAPSTSVRLIKSFFTNFYLSLASLSGQTMNNVKHLETILNPEIQRWGRMLHGFMGMIWPIQLPTFAGKVGFPRARRSS
jgi:hypothetical protein